MNGIDPWALIVMAGVSLAIGAWRLFLPRSEFGKAEKDRDEKCNACRKGIDECVTKESLAQQLAPIVKEQEHRKGTVDSLGKTMTDALARVDRRQQRLEVCIVAIAAKLDVELPKPHDED